MSEKERRKKYIMYTRVKRSRHLCIGGNALKTKERKKDMCTKEMKVFCTHALIIFVIPFYVFATYRYTFRRKELLHT
jgi:hypothetical protein